MNEIGGISERFLFREGAEEESGLLIDDDGTPSE